VALLSSKLAVCSSCEPTLLSPYNIFSLIEIPVPFSLHTTDLIPPLRFVAPETGHQNLSPVLHGSLLTRLRCRKHNAIGSKLNLSLSLPRGSRIGYDAMTCTTSMRRHALLLIALAHSTHFVAPRCGAIAMMLFFSSHPLVSWHQSAYSIDAQYATL
jgi:hypothetical protein